MSHSSNEPIQFGGSVRLSELQSSVHSTTVQDIEERWETLWDGGLEPQECELNEAKLFIADIGTLQGGAQSQVEVSTSHMSFFTREDKSYQKGDGKVVDMIVNGETTTHPVRYGENGMCQINLPNTLAGDYLQDYHLIVKYKDENTFAISTIRDEDVNSSLAPVLELADELEFEGSRRFYYC
ncbi:hypothetical protein C5C07_20105 [Haloferax sp. Atlit-4N]|nr:hypothetical protein C5C07_20105 [Haloferax sp. Atlit-4N]